MTARNEILEDILTAVSAPVTGIGSDAFGWSDLVAPFSSAKGNGTTEPVWSDIGNGHYAYKFTAGDELFVHFHVLHDYKIGSNAYPHIHFIVDSVMNAGEQITWQIGYILAKGHQQGESLSAAESTIDITYTATGNEIAGEHIVLECSDVQSIGLIEPDCILLARVELLSENVTGNIFGIMCDLHYQTDRHSTINKAPDFYS